MGFGNPPAGSLCKCKLLTPLDTLGIVVLTMRHLSLDMRFKKRGSRKRKEKECSRNETSLTDATANSTTGATTNATASASTGPNCGRKAATTLKTPQTRPNSNFSACPGPLPSIYGTILSGGRC